MKHLICLMCLSGILKAGSLEAQKNLANSMASPRTVQTYDLLTNYQSNSDQCIILGQNIGWSMDEFDGLVADLQAQTGVWPGVIGGQLRNAPTEIDYNALVELLLKWQNEGGLVELSMLPNNPFTGGDTWDVSMTNIAELLTPGSEALAAWRAELDFYASFLKELQEVDVTILWRPLMEMNGDWFWYGFQGDDDPTPFVNLYRDLYQYYTEEWQLNNLIWVYCANTSYDGIPEVDHYYPGDDVVDVVGFDVYVTDLDIPINQYEKMVALGKPFALPEFGPSFMDMNGNQNYANYLQVMRRNFPLATYSLAWHSWPDHLASWIANQNVTSAFQEECVLNREEIRAFFASTRVQSKSASPIEIFPNPSRGKFMFKIDEFNHIDEVEMVNLFGESLNFSTIKSENSTLVTAKGVEAGPYFLRVYSKGNWYVEKLIIHH